MTSLEFDARGWIERLAASLAELARIQEPYLEEYREDCPHKRVVVDGRDVTPYPLDDVRGFYFRVRHARNFGWEAHYEPLRRVYDGARHALLSHPVLYGAAVAGRMLGENNFWMRILNSGTSISAADLIAGLMARAAELASDGFPAAASELAAFLAPGADGAAAPTLGNLDEGCDMLMFYGVTVGQKIAIGDGMAILPHKEVRRFVDEELVEELAPGGAAFHGWRSVGAIARPFRWQPAFRRSGILNELSTASPEPFFRQARILLDLIAVSHAAPVLPLASISDCIDRSASRLLGRDSRGPGGYGKWPADGLDGFVERPILDPAALEVAREAFERRKSARFAKYALFVSRLAEALGRQGRFAEEVRTVDVAIALEGMYDLPERGKASELARRASGFIGINALDQQRVRESASQFYRARSEIVHGDRPCASPFGAEAAFVTGFDLARRTLFRLLGDGPPADWKNPAST